MIHDSREVTVRSSSPRNGEINIKVLKKRLDEFGGAGGVIGTEGTFPQSSFTNPEAQLDKALLDVGQLPNSGRYEDSISA